MCSCYVLCAVCKCFVMCWVFGLFLSSHFNRMQSYSWRVDRVGSFSQYWFRNRKRKRDESKKKRNKIFNNIKPYCLWFDRPKAKKLYKLIRKRHCSHCILFVIFLIFLTRCKYVAEMWQATNFKLKINATRKKITVKVKCVVWAHVVC